MNKEKLKIDEKEKIKNKKCILKKYKYNKKGMYSLVASSFAATLAGIHMLTSFTLGAIAVARERAIVHEKGNSKQIVEVLREEESEAYFQYIHGIIDYENYVSASKEIFSSENKLEMIRKHADSETLEELDKTDKIAKAARVVLKTGVVPGIVGVAFAYKYSRIPERKFS